MDPLIHILPVVKNVKFDQKLVDSATSIVGFT